MTQKTFTVQALRDAQYQYEPGSTMRLLDYNGVIMRSMCESRNIDGRITLIQ